MSNVLIGIIGVILFIGLALAGALFLGPRFQESRTNAITSAQVQSLQQLANAANLYMSTENGVIDDPTGVVPSMDLVTKGYLKTVPVDASGGGAYFVYRKNNGILFIALGLQSKAVCDAFNRQINGPSFATPVVFTAADAANQAVCAKDSAAATSTYTLYLKV